MCQALEATEAKSHVQTCQQLCAANIGTVGRLGVPASHDFVIGHKSNSGLTAAADWEHKVRWFEKTKMSLRFQNPFFRIIARQRKDRNNVWVTAASAALVWETEVSFVG